MVGETPPNRGEPAPHSGRRFGASEGSTRVERGAHMSRSRWIKRALAGALTLSAAGGCKQQLFMEPADYSDAIKVQLPKTLETNPHGPIAPPQIDRMEKLTTVIDFVRPARNMTL